MKKYIEGTDFVKERPGLQNITYSARYDNLGLSNLVPSMCERALMHKDARCNILVEFLLDLTTLTPLYIGHKPTTAMIDSRTT